MVQRLECSGNADVARLYQSGDRYLLKVQKKAKRPALAVTIWDERAQTITTGRTMDEYRDEFPILRFVEEYVRQGMRFADIGGGVGGFAPYLASLNPPEKPVVIDPLEYGTAEALLTDALGRAEKGDPPFVLQIERLRTMLDSCQTIRDATKIELYNCTLGTAVKRYPHLPGTIDGVVDYLGATEYAHTEDGNLLSWDPLVYHAQLAHVMRLQRQLLSKTGLLINDKHFT